MTIKCDSCQKLLSVHEFKYGYCTTSQDSYHTLSPEVKGCTEVCSETPNCYHHVVGAASCGTN